MSNLLKDTKSAIKDSGHKPTDIIFIGSEDTGHQCTWDEFERIANVEYDAGFGAAEVASDLLIVFKDGQTMYRGEYDGSEWWEYSKPFKMPTTQLPIKRLVGDYWPSLEALQDDSNTHNNPPTKRSTEL